MNARGMVNGTIEEVKVLTDLLSPQSGVNFGRHWSILLLKTPTDGTARLSTVLNTLWVKTSLRRCSRDIPILSLSWCPLTLVLVVFLNKFSCLSPGTRFLSTWYTNYIIFQP